jgi:hypothetical protein
MALVIAAPLVAANSEASLKSFLRSYLAADGDAATRYHRAFVDLNGDGMDEVVVYLQDRGWCGSGGCTMFILRQQGASFQVVTKTTITQLPIRVLATKSHGWRDLSVGVAGGGIRPGYDAALSFDGKSYPTNPSAAPARRLDANVEGKILIDSSDRGTPLYP